jgi:hypothetical protein
MRYTLPCLLGLTAGALALEPPKTTPPVTPVFKMSRETTVITGPLDKDGYPDYEVAINEKLRGKIKPDQNACVRLWDAWGPAPEGGLPLHADYWKWLGRDVPREKGDYFVDAFKFFKANGRTEFQDSDYDQHSSLNSGPWSAAAYPDYVTWLNANEKALAVVTEAVKRPAYFSPMVSRTREGKPGMLLGSLLPHAQASRGLGDALVKRAMLKVGQEKYDEAWADLLACHRLGRHVAKGGTLIELLVGIALDAIASKAEVAFVEHAKPDAKRARACLKDLESLPPMPVLQDKLEVTERFIMLDAVCHLRRDGIEILDGLTNFREHGDKDSVANKALAGMDWTPALKVCTSHYDRMMAVAVEPDRPTRKAKWAAFENEFNKLKKGVEDSQEELNRALAKGKVDAFVAEKIGVIVFGLLLPASAKVREAQDRCQTTFDTTRFAFALAAYRDQHKAYPATLAALVPKYVAAEPHDVITGKPLIYKPSAEGYVLYSVGMNEIDDGGRLIGDKYQDGETRGDDVGVRMPARKKMP